MIQVDLKKVAELFAQNGLDLADFPELALQAMKLNEELATAPEFDGEALKEMLALLLDKAPPGVDGANHDEDAT